jgi:glucose/arabinose dehydrogenase
MRNKITPRKSLIIVLLLFTVVAIFVFLLAPKNTNKEGKDNFQSEVLLENLDTPWALDFLPDGKMIFTERRGIVSIYDFGRKEKSVIAEIPATEISESGLMGVATDPDFNNNKFIYFYYTYEINQNVWNRVSRFFYDGAKLSNERILLDRIPAARFHDGGRIKFGPDEKLYVTTGDATVPSSSQDTNSLAGKILRMNKDGSVPEENPFGNYVYSYGHRNPQGIAWNDGNLFASEHGPSRNDEINAIYKGKNYGWPDECTGLKEKQEKPVKCFTEFTLAPSGIAFYNGDLYVAGLRGTQLRRIIFDKDFKAILREEELFGELGRIREAVEHEGYLYIATNNRDGRGNPKSNDDKIIKLTISNIQ